MDVWTNGVLVESVDPNVPTDTVVDVQVEPTAEERLEALEAAMLELLGLSNVDDLYHK